MFYLSRRQAHAVLAGAGAALAYLAAAELGSKKPVRVGGLLTLGFITMAGIATSKASVKAVATEARLNGHIAATAPAINLVNNGGTIGGTLTVAGDHIVTGVSHTHLTAPSGFGNVQVQSGGLGILSGNVDVNGNSVVNASSVGGGGSPVSLPDGTSHGGSLVMNGNNGFTFGHITSNQIGPGGNRAALGGTATNAALTSRCDFLLAQLQGANICY